MSLVPGTQERSIDFNVCISPRTPHGMIIKKFSMNVGCGLWERKVRVVSPKEKPLASGPCTQLEALLLEGSVHISFASGQYDHLCYF